MAHPLRLDRGEGRGEVSKSTVLHSREREKDQAEVRLPAGRMRVVGEKPTNTPAPSPATINAFKAQVTQWAERIRVRPRQLRLQPMRRKWASCSTRGTVSFSTEVLAQPAAFREYVIVHELLHLKVPNHGKLFKTLLRAYIPNFESIQPRPHS